ncbi:MAG: transposase family protein [Acidimicrobiaceae bacterium]|nr:transposase family protein [Acidimicrobiaceae bacterium]
MEATSARPVVVGPGGTGVVAHVGLHALCSFADRLGLGSELSCAIPRPRERAPLHDRGKVLVHAMAMLAGGGEACSDIEFLRSEQSLFGNVASDSTPWRTFHEITPSTRAELKTAIAGIRAEVWRRSSATTGSAPVVLDVDASLVEIHTEAKDGTGPTYKGGYGVHPLLCFADATGELLSAMLRPGNAGANDVADHLVVLDEPLSQLPVEIAAGHREGDDTSLVRRDVVVRADSAGCTAGFLAGLRARNVGFSVVARSTRQITEAIFTTLGHEELWAPAVRQDGELRKGAAVMELTELVDLGSVPEGTRLIVRREPLHPGAQQTLFPSLDYRYWGHYSDRDGDPVTLDAFIRAHAHVEEHISRLKDSGLCRFPFSNLEANRNWLMVVAAAADRVRWFQLLCLDGALSRARPKQLCWSIFHAPGRLVRSARREFVRILDGWPSAEALLTAYRKIELLT